MEEKIVANDLLKIYEKVVVKGKPKKRIVTVLAWGDALQVGKKKGNEIPVRVNARFWRNGEYVSGWRDAFVSDRAKFMLKDSNEVVKFSVCDVGQGDASILETPKGKRVFVDCGENKLFARYIAARYENRAADNRLPVDAVVLTHGDRDHFGGLLEIQKSEEHQARHKRIFIDPLAIYHSGLVKRKGKKDKEAFGATAALDGRAYAVDLVDDIAEFDPEAMNEDFKRLRAAIGRWKKDARIKKRGGITIKRLSARSDGSAFDFLSGEGIDVVVLAPIEATVGGAPSLPMYLKPAKAVPEAQGEELDANLKLSASYSASHTVNGNSIVLLVSYGNVRLLLTGDINQESEKAILDRSVTEGFSLRADVLKAPHHGSSEFSTEFLEKVMPVVSVISSGDESERVEYIHPRATLVGALGKYSRVPRPIVFITELVAFMKYRGLAVPLDKKIVTQKDRQFYAHERTSYGIVHFCFDKSRILVFTHSGKRDLKEAYAIKIARDGSASFDGVTIA